MAVPSSVAVAVAVKSGLMVSIGELASHNPAVTALAWGPWTLPVPGPSYSRSEAFNAEAGLIMLILPLASDRLFNAYYLDLATRIIIIWIALLGYDILAGYTGLVSFGQAMFFGLGAYGAAWALLYVAPSLPLVLLIGVAASTTAAVIIGYLSIRTRGVYFILLTLVFC